MSLSRVSASQVVEFQRCNRRWYNAYLLGMREPPTDAMLRGTAIHALVERYLKGEPMWSVVDGKSSPYFKIVEAALPHLPVPGMPDTKVEEWIDMPTRRAGLRFVGRYDSIDWSLPRVYDCKTTSDFRYAKSPAEMLADVQLNAYARHVVETHSNPARVHLRLVYMRTRGAARAMPLDVNVGVDEVLKTWEKTLDTVDQMAEIAEASIASAQDLQPNTASCHAYNKPCPYLRMCTGEGPEIPIEWLKIGVEKFHDKARADAARMDAQPETGGPKMAENLLTPEENALPLKARMDLQKARAAGQAALAPAPAPAPTPVPAKVDSDAEWQLYVCPKCKGKKWMPSDDPSSPPGAFFECDGCRRAGFIKAVRSPAEPAELAVICTCTTSGGVDAACPVTGLGVHAPGTVRRAGDMPKPAAAAPAVAIIPPDAPLRTSTPEEIAAEEAKVKKGRPKKASAPAPAAQIKIKGADGQPLELASEKLAPVIEQAADAAAKAAIAVTPATAAVPELKAPPKATNGAVKPLALYIDCLPQKGAHAGGVVEYVEWLAPIAAAVAAKAGKADWRMIEYTAEGDLCAAIRAAVPGLPEAIVVTGSSRSRAAFLEAVAPHATSIVRGL